MSKIKSTIIYTDVVGYSRLTGENQELALELLAEHDKILYQYTKHYDGRIIKKTGDGICALFNEPEKAIRCSIDIQKDLNKRNKLNTKERQVEIRIGIHFDSLIENKNDAYGDGILIAKNIESSAPHGGIAISESVNSLIKNINDLYSREYMNIEFNNNNIQLYEIYPNLLNWYQNEKKQNSQSVNSKSTYKNAHNFFHNSDYSTALKYASLALQNASGLEKNEIYSFICHSLVSLGEFDFASKELMKLKSRLADDIEIELEAHLYKMEALLYFNNKEWIKSESLFEKSLDVMTSVNTKYVNEIVYNIGNIYLLNDKLETYDKYTKYLKDKDDYTILIEGLHIIASKNNKDPSKYLDRINKINNIHLKSIANWYASIYFKNLQDNDNMSKYILKSQDLLVSASEKISDWFQRENFLKQILIHNEIINFHDNIKIDFSDLDIDVEKNDKNIEEKNLIYKFCPQCGSPNENRYKFCIHCGNNLKI